MVIVVLNMRWNLVGVTQERKRCVKNACTKELVESEELEGEILLRAGAAETVNCPKNKE